MTIFSGVISKCAACFTFQKQDPAQFLRMYGRPVKIHLDQAVALAAEGPQSMYDDMF